MTVSQAPNLLIIEKLEDLIRLHERGLAGPFMAKLMNDTLDLAKQYDAYIKYLEAKLT